MNEMRDNESQTFDPMCCRFQCKLTCFVFSSFLAKLMVFYISGPKCKILNLVVAAFKHY